MKRRRFSVKAGGVLAAARAAGIVDATNVIAQPKVQWRMSTAFPAARRPAIREGIEPRKDRVGRLWFAR
jgi:TRAP-type mannitol/chloroaromatic compound transport system substrate-binding protein